MPIFSPFPYPGGKARRAAEFWSFVGKHDAYVEPFAGSCAILLNNPNPSDMEIVVDIDPMIINFWRAIQYDYKAVAYYADWPSFHDDLTARHRWLVDWKIKHMNIMLDDDSFSDVQAAGWWLWGISNWIGGGFCALPLTGKHDINKRQYINSTSIAGQGTQHGKIFNKRPHIKSHLGGSGVQQQRIADQQSYIKINIEESKKPQLQNKISDKRPYIRGSHGRHGAQIVSQKRPLMSSHVGGVGAQKARTDLKLTDRDGERLYEYLRQPAERIANVKFLCGDWKRIFEFQKEIDQCKSPCWFLDPPYKTEMRDSLLYQSDADKTSTDVAIESYNWAIENGDQYKIAYCSYTGDFEFPQDWRRISKSFSGLRKSTQEKKSDEIAYSPACYIKQPNTLINLF